MVLLNPNEISTDSLTQKFRTIERDLHVLVGKRNSLEQTIADYDKRLVDITNESALLTVTRELLQKVSVRLRLQISSRFAALATDAIRYIFQRNDLTFVVELDVKSNLPVASFYVQVGDHSVNPRDALGGSIYEIIGICLRLVCLEVFKLRGPLILDEPLRSVDDTNLLMALEFIQQYCKGTGRQLFMVTHNAKIARMADKLFEVTQVNGDSIVSEKDVIEEEI